MRGTNLALLGVALVVAAAPVLGLVPRGSDFTGADGQAQEAILQIRPDYQPWSAPLWQPPSKEIESALFALQAALGAGLFGYLLGRRHGRRRSGDGEGDDARR
jgi:cobalt/nickel transport protein